MLSLGLPNENLILNKYLSLTNGTNIEKIFCFISSLSIDQDRIFLEKNLRKMTLKILSLISLFFAYYFGSILILATEPTLSENSIGQIKNNNLFDYDLILKYLDHNPNIQLTKRYFCLFIKILKYNFILLDPTICLLKVCRKLFFNPNIRLC